MSLQLSAASAEAILLEKKLSQSDLSDQVLKSGRIVLPRVMMEDKAELIIALGCTDINPSDPATEASATWTLEVVDTTGREWALLLKKWTAAASVQPRPIYVLEQSMECMLANGASPGDCMQLSIKDNNHLLLRILPMKDARVISQRKIAGNECNGFASSYRQPSSGVCHRSEGCLKEYGHVGFCTGQQSVRSTQPALYTNLLVPGAARSHATRDHRRPEWVNVRCGNVKGRLHVPTMSVNLSGDDAAHNNISESITLADFERLGGMAHCRKWRTSVVVVPDTSASRCITLGRWLQRWPPSPNASNNLLHEGPNTNVVQSSSIAGDDTDITTAANALLSVRRGTTADNNHVGHPQGGSALGDPGRRSVFQRFTAPRSDLNEPHNALYRPRPVRAATPAEGLALYEKVAKPAVGAVVPRVGMAVHPAKHVEDYAVDRIALENNLSMVLDMLHQC